MKVQYRVKSATEFQALIERKKSDKNHHFVIYHQPKTEAYARAGISVGKKMGNAVFRNKVKRQLRMMMQDIYKADYSFDCVIIVRFKYFKDDYHSNYQQLEDLFKTIEKRRY